MSEQKATTSSSLHLDPAAAARLLSALDTPTPPPDHPANTGANPVAPPAYIIDRALGSGGGGTVYRAFREGSDRPVALKILDYSLSLDSEGKPRQFQAAQRAWRELQLLEDLHLPVLPRLLDHGVMPSGRVFFATEFIEGKTLEAFAFSSLPPLGGMGVPPVPTPSTASLPGIPGAHEAPGTRGFADSSPACDEESLSSLALLLARVCDAVQVLHEHGILHRDLKPSNILIDLHGQPILIDLGIAAIFEYPGGTDLQSVSSSGGAGFRPAFPTLTETGAPIGTPAYMAPEQARGERHRISTRSDVFSLGATAYRILTGATPHDTNTTIHEAIRRVAFDEARDPRTLSPGLPKPLAAVLLKACAREPEKRYATAAALGTDLRRWANGEAVEAVPPGAWERGVRWAGRHAVATTVLLCAAIALSSLGATAIALTWYTTVPYKIAPNLSVGEYWLVSRSGVILQSWKIPPNAARTGRLVAERVDRPPVLGGGWVIVSNDSDSHPFGIREEQLAVWNPSSRDAPLWYTRPEDLVPPAGSPNDDSMYRVSFARVADVFLEFPGKEVVAVHTRNTSPAAIRIYNIETGQMLFEAWHRGHVIDLQWIGESRVLVGIGLDNGSAWRHPTVARVLSTPPLVVFALQPGAKGRFGLINSESPDARVGDVLTWYRYLQPADFILEQEFMPNVAVPSNAGQHAPLVEIVLDHPRFPIAVNLLINGLGEIVKRSFGGDWSRVYPDVQLSTFGLCDAPERPLRSPGSELPTERR